MIYQISIKELYSIVDEGFVINMMTTCLNANSYFLDLHCDMKSKTLKQKTIILKQNHSSLLNSRLLLISAFLGASVTRLSSTRKSLE